MKRRIAVGVGVACVALLGLFILSARRTNSEPLSAKPKGVTVAVATATEFREQTRYIGTLEPWQEANVGPQMIAAYVDTVLVRPGATVATYIWDVAAGGFPAQPVWAALALLGAPQPVPPQAGAAGVEALEALWRGAGLLDIRQRAISITRRFADFETYWQACQDSTSIRAALAALAPAEAAKARAHAQSLVQMLPDGSVAVDAHANAIRGRVG